MVKLKSTLTLDLAEHIREITSLCPRATTDAGSVFSLAGSGFLVIPGHEKACRSSGNRFYPQITELLNLALCGTGYNDAHVRRPAATTSSA
jgi:hypothetical protein